MSKFAAAERQAESRKLLESQSDPNFRFAQNLSQGMGQDLQAGLQAALSGDLSGLDLVQLGLKSQTIRAIGDFITTINTQDTEAPPSRGQSIVRDIKDLKLTIESILEVQNQLIKMVEEVASLQLPELGLDPLEMATKGLPGISISDVEKQLGRCV